MAQRSTAKDFCLYWAKKYREVVGKSFHINWLRDASTFRRLMSDFTNVELRSLIDFAFSDEPVTNYMSSQGYPIGLFPSQINQYNTVLNNPGSTIPFEDLELDIPVWNDNRTAYIYYCVMDGDLKSLIDNVENDYYWRLLIEKMNRSGLVTKKVLLFFDMWKSEDEFERTRIKNEN